MVPLFRNSLTSVIAVSLLFASATSKADELSQDGVAFFEKKIRPVLIEHCYECHSQDAAKKNKLRGGLILDNREAMLQGGDSGASIEAGDPDSSLLLESLRYESFEMPPSGMLSEQIVADFEKWIEMGAPDPRDGAGSATVMSEIDIEAGREHWCYRPLDKPRVPETSKKATSAIDAFVLQRLDSAQMKQVAGASRTILIRRLYFDLLGVPPTAEQIERFVSDGNPNAYECLVDRLLASPQFGERWGRHWLDVVRYAESNTLRGFVFHEAWRYRDYVIEAFNSDRPFDQFTREQIAGDLLPASTLEERQRNAVATTFLALGNNNYEDQDKDKLRMDVVDEQLDTIGRGFLAQTIGCARCHDHKFDPIPTHDYYALAGILRNTKTLNHANVSQWIEKDLPLAEEQEAEYDRRRLKIEELQGEIDQRKQELGLVKAASQSLPLNQVPGIFIDDLQAELTGVWTSSQSVPGFIGKGYQHTSNNDPSEKTATFRPESPLVGEYEVRFAYTAGGNRSTHVPVKIVSGDGEKTVIINQQKRPPVEDHFVSLGRYRFNKTVVPEVFVSNKGVMDVLIIDGVQFLPVEQLNSSLVTGLVANQTDPVAHEERETLQAEVKKLEKRLADLKSQNVRPKYMTVEEHAQIGDSVIHIRGDVHNLGVPAPRGFLQVALYGAVSAIPTQESGRRELGDWIVDQANPLTARVLANRIWHWIFGRGIVRTTDNFGTTGERPSHPELLDYLACRLLENDWSIKKLIREIVLSRTYRLSSAEQADAIKVDPENRLLWRMNRRRIDAECLLDAMLVVNGELDLQIGGSMIRPGTGQDYNYKHDGNRRAVYWPVFRNSLPDIFRVFDFANPSVGTGRRNSSSTPPQALFLMNNPWVIRQAEMAADRALKDRSLDDAQRVREAVLSTFGREPTSAEADSMLTFVESTANEAERKLRWTQLYQTLFASIDFRYID